MSFIYLFLDIYKQVSEREFIKQKKKNTKTKYNAQSNGKFQRVISKNIHYSTHTEAEQILLDNLNYDISQQLGRKDHVKVFFFFYENKTKFSLADRHIAQHRIPIGLQKLPCSLLCILLFSLSIVNCVQVRMHRHILPL